MLYEMLYILSPKLNETETQHLQDEVKKTIVNSGGEITKESNWGTRKLAYEIKKKTEGTYVYYEFDAPTDIPKSINELMHTRTGIIRHLILQIPKAKLIQEKRDADKKQKELEEAQKQREEALAAEARAKAAEEAQAEAQTKPEKPEQPTESAAEPVQATETTPEAPAQESKEEQPSAETEEKPQESSSSPAEEKSQDESHTEEVKKEESATPQDV